ncbi:molybdopterin-guanine dinucleotide biosynthesis protein B [Paenibacillus sp. YPG26]|uniref:molybdopterin-guanine dinucleotide biosynthesis protein B n=1 Tax=Paenibacillus sp. YPG26 TaxID=2878915 RepID=UPI00203DF500|nr:molybdopterin-guanine dinucleotide biosynthesis protein B [Paenibacillus sp. YPG26]USB31585.1 molybdopterin-guanine dinucleotide biosynthesis protein B [Paenibacillus sp. YPG26]
MKSAPVPVFQIVGYKNTGKTHLVSRLTSYFTAKGLRVAVIKHDLHEFEMDKEGTDTYQHTAAGAAAVAITSPTRTAVLEEKGTALSDLIARFAEYDLVLVEGFKQEAYPKLLILRNEKDLQLLSELTNVKKVAVWPELIFDMEEQENAPELVGGLERYDIDDTHGIATAVSLHFSL